MRVSTEGPKSQSALVSEVEEAKNVSERLKIQTSETKSV